MENNPLKQYFRRPAVYLRLPSGISNYGDEVITKSEVEELPVYPMTAIDEITARTPDALFNGTAVAELMKSCIPSIKDPWKIKSIDLDAILIAIKAASGGENLDIDTVCPTCEDLSTFQINLIAILSSLQPGDYDKLLELGDLSIKFRPLNYKEMNNASVGQFEVQRVFANLYNIEDDKERNRISHEALEKITMLTMELVSSSIIYIKTPNAVVEQKEFILDFLKHTDKNIYNTIRDYNASLKANTEIKPLEITCPNCSHQYKQEFTLNPADFFE